MRVVTVIGAIPSSVIADSYFRTQLRRSLVEQQRVRFGDGWEGALIRAEWFESRLNMTKI